MLCPERRQTGKSHSADSRVYIVLDDAVRLSALGGGGGVICEQCELPRMIAAATQSGSQVQLCNACYLRSAETNVDPTTLVVKDQAKYPMS